MTPSNYRKPFYLIQEGPNVILSHHVNQFASHNRKLTPFLKQHPLELRLLPLSPFQSFCFWVIAQQISSHASSAIIERFEKAICPLTPKRILKTNLETFRTIGLSQNKVTTLFNLAHFFTEQKAFRTDKLSSQTLVQQLTTIHGIGEWTVHMHLIFSEGRMDILASRDLAVRQGVQKLYNTSTIPSEKEVKQLCKNWGNLATVGTLLAWAVKEPT